MLTVLINSEQLVLRVRGQEASGQLTKYVYRVFSDVNGSVLLLYTLGNTVNVSPEGLGLNRTVPPTPRIPSPE